MSSDRSNKLTGPQIPRIWHDPRTCMKNYEGQCDCACAVSPLELHCTPTGIPCEMVQLTSPFTVVPVIADRHAVLTGQTSGASVLNDAALSIARHFEQPHSLAGQPSAWRDRWGSPAVEVALERLVYLGVLAAADQPAPRISDGSTTLVAWLHLTQRCNLRCSYCYLSPGAQDMSLDTGKAALEATFRSAGAHGYRQVKLKYAGGEPLLCFPKVVDLHRYAQSLAMRRGVSLDGVVLSNGTLLNASMVATMKALGLRLMISLDGLHALHDQQRYHLGGRGSFVEVERAIDLALTYDLLPEISVTVSAMNVAGLPDLVAWLLERDLPFGFNYYRENACSSGRDHLTLMDQDMIDGMLKAFAVIEHNLPRRSLLTSLVDLANLTAPHAYPCHAGRSYLVFDTQGRVAKCQMQVDQAIDTTKTPDPLALVKDDAIGLQNPSVEQKVECRACDWKYWCAGGCPLAARRAIGRYDARSPYCRIYQTLFPAAVRLEGLRVLKYAV